MSTRNNNQNNGKKKKGNSNNKKKKNGRRRPRSEIGLGSKGVGIHFDPDNDDEHQHPSESGPLPSFEELCEHWKMDPTCPGRLLCKKDDGVKYKIVVPMEDIYETCVKEHNNRTQGWASFGEYKAYMMDKYYIDEDVLDLLLVTEDEKDARKEKEAQQTARDEKEKDCDRRQKNDEQKQE